MPSSPPRVKRLLLIVLGLGFAGCIDPIDLDVGEPTRQIVIVGTVAEGPGPHRVTLTRSAAFTQGLDALRQRERHAYVVVTAGDGSEAVFLETGPGTYVIPEGVLVGEVGQTYQLRVVLQDGSEYRSPQIEMLPSTEILGVEPEIVEGFRLVGDVLIDDPRVQISVDAEIVSGRQTFFRWTWEGVHSNQVCWPPNSPNTECAPCYVRTESRSLVEIATSSSVTGEVLESYPAETFPIGQYGYRFTPAYYLRVQQEALTPEAYSYWTLIRDMRDNVGSLFDPPAEAVHGNMTNVDDPHDYALGYFSVVGTSHTDLCVRRSEFDDFPTTPPAPIIFGQCGITVEGSPTPPPAYVAACNPA